MADQPSGAEPGDDASSPGSSSVSTPALADNLRVVREGIAEASREAQRGADDVTLVIVTKFHPASLVRSLHGLGERAFGENRHQEAQAKSAELADLDLEWHFVGQLQSKKARQAAAYVRAIHSLDRDSVIDALGARDLDADSTLIDGFVQINLTDDAARGGVDEVDVERFADRVAATPGLTLRGVMAVAPLGVDPRRAFARVREISESVVRNHPQATAISMGMSGDYRDAILEGATHLRVGSAITGNRPAER
ncbi:YggS family pyridoxal phosphate-dependent enzyme [Marisediminicola sp. LYQ134]|uniref:YggS family pyridoxal phosphate-dependent enzyme n=1 Tax=unclassified Marisediminicola TaxID=2618316 RepID=UPI003983912F